MLHANRSEQFRAPGLGLLRRLILQQAGQSHILLHRQRRQQIEELEHEPDLCPAQAGQSRFVEPVDRLVLEINLAAGQDIEPAQHMEQRALAATARPHDGHEFAPLDAQADSVECVDRRPLRIRPAVKLGGLLDADHAPRPFAFPRIFAKSGRGISPVTFPAIFSTRLDVDFPGTRCMISM